MIIILIVSVQIGCHAMLRYPVSVMTSWLILSPLELSKFLTVQFIQ